MTNLFKLGLLKRKRDFLKGYGWGEYKYEITQKGEEVLKSFSF